MANRSVRAVPAGSAAACSAARQRLAWSASSRASHSGWPGPSRCACAVSDRQEILAVCCRDGGGLVSSCLEEPFGGELPDGLEQPVAKAVASLFRLHQALVHQRAEKA